MKKSLKYLGLLILIPGLALAQLTSGLDLVTPVHNNMIAIKKNGEWAFLNRDGEMVIDFSDKYVATKNEDGTYPVFEDERCLISVKEDGITYFGYSNKSGKTVIEPQFLNARAFKNQKAIALYLKRTEISKNIALGKPVVSYDYFEVLIDDKGEILDFLSDAYHITLHKDYLVKPPMIKSKFVSDHIIAVLGKDDKWSLKKIE